MMKWMLAAGAAALAISAPIAAEKGGQGKGQGSQKEQVDRGGGGQKQARAERGGGERKIRAARIDRGGDRSKTQAMRFVQDDNRGKGRGEIKAARSDNRGRGNDRLKIDNRGSNKVREVRADDNRGSNKVREVRIDDNRGRDRVVDLDEGRVFKVRDVDRDGVRFRDVDRDNLFAQRLGWGAGGCPPGLDKKDNGCMPPGQAKKFIGQSLLAASRFGTLEPLPNSFRSLFVDDDDYYYRYGGNYLYRVDRDDDLIDGLIPLFGAALIGQPLNSSFINPYNRPSYFNSFYPNSPYDCYQYGYGYVYETDCMSGLVEDVIPTYDYGYGVGQLMPSSYSYYNVPYAYRSYFNDNDDYYYRYAPGAIYQVDRDTALISAVAALLTGGLSVGQQLPLGYSAYNVPMAYRANYYDTPDMWYRYDNGYIYQVDPTTRLVQAIVQAIV